MTADDEGYPSTFFGQGSTKPLWSYRRLKLGCPLGIRPSRLFDGDHSGEGGPVLTADPSTTLPNLLRRPPK